MTRKQKERAAPDTSLGKFLAEEKRKEMGETLSVLDQLRRTRRARGGVGAPLQVPVHLRDAAAGRGIVITDADLNTGLDEAMDNIASNDISASDGDDNDSDGDIE